MSDTEQKIVEYIQKTYNPVGIILHGSRARGDAMPKSDWDLLVLVDHDFIQTTYGVEVEGEYLDPFVMKTPVTRESFLKEGYLVPALTKAKILFDHEENAENAISLAKELHTKGKILSPEEIENRKQFVSRCLNRMHDASESDPLVFQCRLGRDFLPRALDYWFMILHKRWSESVRVALEVIAKEDQEYFMWLQILLTNAPIESKLKVAENIHKRLFK